jgi:hypothetical protein
VPLGVEIELQVAVVDPIHQGTFKITGIDDRTIKLMEPSMGRSSRRASIRSSTVTADRREPRPGR